jgi:nondiscriminating glutamyl-tRNA synthetase
MAQKLIEEGKAYYCFCTDEELEKRRQEALSRGESPHYDGKCRNISKNEALERIKNGEKAVIRFKVLEEDIEFKDIVRGELKFEYGVVGDFIIMRSNGMPTYNFAVVIDDMSMKVTHIFRGEEHLSNTPRQIMLYKAFNAPIPEFGHLSLLLGEDRQKLSKRNGSSSVSQLREEGILPKALINYLFLLGWTSHSDQEIFEREEMTKIFDSENLVKNPQVFDIKKLRWINHHYIKELSDEDLIKYTREYVDNKFLENAPSEFIDKVILACRNDLETLRDINKRAPFFFNENIQYDSSLLEFLPDINALKELFSRYVEILNNMETLEKQAMHKELKTLGKELGIKGKSLFIPMRLALTGQEEGPGVYDIIYAIGAERTKKRFDNLLSWIDK